MSTWPEILRAAAIGFAVAGGAASLFAVYRERTARPGAVSKRLLRATYLVSYILMSLSIFCLAAGSLLR